MKELLFSVDNYKKNQVEIHWWDNEDQYPFVEFINSDKVEVLYCPPYCGYWTDEDCGFLEEKYIEMYNSRTEEFWKQFKVKPK